MSEYSYNNMDTGEEGAHEEKIDGRGSFRRKDKGWIKK